MNARCFVVVLLCAFCLNSSSRSSSPQVSTDNDVTPLLLPGLGTHHHPISTTNPEAQKYFDQGLMLVLGFNRAEAVRSFRRAAQLDPKAAMPYWGMALAYGRHMNMIDGDVQPERAYAAIQKALALSANVSPKEQEYIRALALRCSNDPNADGDKLDAAYAGAMGELARHYSDDLDAVSFSLEAHMVPHRYEWFHEDMPAEGTMDVIRQIEEVLRRDPYHPLANHLCIHILDTAHPEQALGCAYRLGQVAPGLGHLQHMPAHILFNVGDYEMAARVNEQAAAAEREYQKLAKPGYTTYTTLYYLHDLHFVSRSRTEQGLFEEGKVWAEDLADYIRPVQDQWPMISDYYLPVPLLNLLRFQRWDEILKMPEPDSHRLISGALWHFGRGMAFAAKRQRELAVAERAKLDQARRDMPADTMWMFNKGQDLLNVASLVLKARIAQDQAQAVQAWTQAVSAQDSLAYDEPPPWYYPIRESLGAAQLRAGKASEAEATFRECLRGSPRDGRALYGLMESLEAQQKQDAAESVKAEFQNVWKGKTLPKVEDF